MIDADFVTEIVQNAKPSVLAVNGKEYSSAALHNPPPPYEPQYPSVRLASLDSFAEFVNAIPEEAGRFIACSDDSVALISTPKGENRIRETIVSASPNVQPFQFGVFKPLEDFRIAILTGFVDTPWRANVLLFVSQITDQNVMTSNDDGVSQTVTAKTGIASYGKVEVPSPVRLQPIRTFIEVEQPEGTFILRLKQQEKGLPLAGLFELHTNWERQAAINVKTYLQAKVAKIPIYA